MKPPTSDCCGAAKWCLCNRSTPIRLSAPFHSSLLQPASDKLREYLAGVSFSAPLIPLINNVDVAIVSDPAAIKDALVRQAASPVRWVETVLKMQASGMTHIVECGPGKVLAGLTKRIHGDLIGDAFFDQATLDKVLETLNSFLSL